KMGNTIDQWRCAIGRFHPCRQHNRCDNTERRAEREYRKALHENKAHQNRGKGTHESKIQHLKKHLDCLDQKVTIKPNHHVNNLKKIQELAKECNEWFEVVSKGYTDTKDTFKQNVSADSTVTTIQSERSQCVTVGDEKGTPDQNISLNYNIDIVEEDLAASHEKRGIHKYKFENNTENVKVPMNQRWIMSLRKLPQLLVIITILLIIGGI
ncbi:unnamed protein product, partial [Owenia fusiformis]